MKHQNLRLMFSKPRCHRLSQSKWRTLSLFLFVIGIAVAGVRVFGCGWPGTDESVRFNSFRTPREMGRLPPLPTMSNGLNEARAAWVDAYYDGSDSDSASSVDEQMAEHADHLWASALQAEQQGEIQESRQLLRQYLSQTKLGRMPYWVSLESRQHRRNSAIDRLDVIDSIDRNADLASLEGYLAARRAYDDKKPAPEIQAAIDAIPPEKDLRDNVAYLRAASLQREAKFEEAARAFDEISKLYQRSEKREAALLMSAIAHMKRSLSYTGVSGDDTHNAGSYDNDQSAPASAPEDNRDEAWHAARTGFLNLISEYPHGHYTRDARGWLAHLNLRGGDRAGALVEYYRLLGDDTDENARLEAAFSLSLVRHHATEAEMRRVEADLEDEPSAALAYAYHNIYNYSIDPGCPFDYYSGSGEGQESQLEQVKLSTEQIEKARIVAFASRLMRRYPRSQINSKFTLRVAQANLEQGEDRKAKEFARRALQSGLRNEERADALFVLGVAEHRLRNYVEARKALSRLIEEYPKGKLLKDARRMLAMVAEDAGDIDAALEQYIALDYTLDVAYLVDVLMTPEQLSEFIERHPDSPKRAEVMYALGLRHLRAGRYPQARQIFAHVRTTEPGYSLYSANDYELCEDGCSPKNPLISLNQQSGIRSRWLLYDTQTANDLERLEREAEAAQGDEAKAEALYQLASYIYQAGTLLFYNPAAWKGERYRNLSDLQEFGKYRAPNEAQTLWQYMQEHETLARALPIYLEVVRRFPQTRAARDAFYTAAVCHDRLQGFNPYWRDAYTAGLHAGARMVTYKDVRATYPDYQLPRGTDGWEPATRTVNGGAGWHAPPKPLPRMTRRERARHYLSLSLDWIKTFWAETLRRWLTIGLALFGVLLVWRRAARARRTLRFRLARRRARQGLAAEETLTWRSLNESEEEARWGFRERARHFVADALRRAGTLASDARLRPSLATNAIAHALLVTLLVTLGWMLYAG